MSLSPSTVQRTPHAVIQGYEGTIVAGSYDPANNTVDVVLGETLADFDDSGDDGPGFAVKGELETTQIGDQTGPQGGERAVLMPARCGWRVLLHHGADDSPQAPTGERHILHAKMGTLGAGNTPVWDSGAKFTNDAATEGDALGGTYVGNQGALTQSQTASGARHTIDDTAQTIETSTAGGMTGTYSDPDQTITHSPSPNMSIYSRLDAIEQRISHFAGPNTFGIIDAAEKLITHQAKPNILSTIDGTAQVITHQATPSVMTIIDGAGNAISHVVPLSGGVGLGGVFSEMNPTTTGPLTATSLTSSART